MLILIGLLYLLSALSHSTTPAVKKGEVSEFQVEPPFSTRMSHEKMQNVCLPLEPEEHFQISEYLQNVTMNELAEELHLSFPVLSESFSPINEDILPKEHEEIIIETEGGNRLGRKRASEGECEQGKKKTRFC